MSDTEEGPKIPDGVKHEIVKDAQALSKRCEDFDFQNSQLDIMQLGADLVKNMVDYNGIGLSAPQIGFNLRVFSMRTAPKNTVVVNPRVLHLGQETETLDEGCLSFPNYVVKVKRPKVIRVRFAYPNGEIKTETYTGLTARVFLHELDHIDGVLFFNRASRYHREQAERHMKRREKILRTTTQLPEGVTRLDR